MEPMGAFSTGEWDPLLLFSNEDLDFAQRVLLGQHPCDAEGFADQIPAMFGSEFIMTPNPNSSQDSSYYYSGNDNIACGFYTTPSVDQYSDGSYNNCYYDPMQMEETDPFLPNYSGIVTVDVPDQIQPPGDPHQVVPEVPAAEKPQLLKRKSKAAISNLSMVEEDDSNGKPKNPKKKPRVSRDTSKKNSQPRRKQKARSDLNEAEDQTKGKQEEQTSSICSSDDELINEESASALNSDGKPRASRGAATDPQSLYARKRRERINERLKTLQNLVPNGTKVDISTMLEEAVHYVKFLQLQIKLLSSDDTWMYAPIAYNGMDIGLNQILHGL